MPSSVYGPVGDVVSWKTRIRTSATLADLVAIAFMGIVAAIANTMGISVLLFPELAALSYDVLRRPTGKWAVQPFRLIITPTLTAIVGLIVTQHSDFGIVPVLVIILASLAIIRLLKSSIGPAISAGLLPLVLEERHWLYPVAIFADLSCLVALLWFWKCFRAEVPVSPLPQSIADKLHAPSMDRFWLVHLITFTITLVLIGQGSHIRLVLFPPVVVMAFEIFGHPELPRWAERPILFPIACALAAVIGICTKLILGSHAWTVMAVLAASIVLLRLFKIHMPPALAVGLIPFILGSPVKWYPLAVSIGAGILTGWTLLRSHHRKSRL